MPYFILFLYFRKTLPWHVGCMPVQTLSSTSGPHSRRRCWVSCLELCHSSPSTSSSRQTGYVTSWIYLRWRPTRNDGCSTGHVFIEGHVHTSVQKFTQIHKTSLCELLPACSFYFFLAHCCGDSVWFSSGYNSGRIWINHHNAALPILSLCLKGQENCTKIRKILRHEFALRENVQKA